MIASSLLPRLCTTRKVRLFGLLALKLSLFLPYPLCAQSRTIYTVRIPFTFIVGGQELPPGNYTVTRLFGHICQFTRPDGRAMGATTVNSAYTDRQPETGKVVFHQYNGHYFLSSLWTAGSRDGYEIPASKQEKQQIELAKASRQADQMVALNVGAPQK